MWNSQVIIMLLEGIRDTLYMTLASTLFGYIIGLPMGIVLTVTDQGRHPSKCGSLQGAGCDFQPAAQYSVYYFADCADSVHQICGGKKLRIDGDDRPADDCGGTLHCQNGRILIKRGGCGVIEAARSMGASDFQIVTKVMLVEARTSLIVGATISLGTILGYSAMAGTVGGGGLGDIAIRYGYTRWQTDIMVVTVVLLVILFQIFQTIGMKIANRLDRRK